MGAPAALAAARDAHVEGPVLNDFSFGGYLMFSGVQPFIDGRAELYGDAFLHEYDVAARLAPQTLDRWREQYGFETALTLTGSVFDMRPSRDGRTVIFTYGSEVRDVVLLRDFR